MNDELTRQLYEALQALYDEQNGPPLIRNQAQWESAMREAETALAAVARHFLARFDEQPEAT